MRFTDYIVLAFRNIRRQKLRSLLTIFAVVIGALSVTIMLSLVFSAKGFMIKQFEQSGLFEQVVVSPETDITWNDKGNGANQCPTCVKLDEKLIDKISALPHVTGISRNVRPYAFQAIEFEGQKLRVNNVTAHDINGVQTENIIAGREFDDNDGNESIIITSDYADKFGFKNNYQALIGKTVKLPTNSYYSGEGSDPKKTFNEQQEYFNTHPDASGQDFVPPEVVLSAEIIGISDTLDSSYTIRVPLEWARGLYKNFQYNPNQICDEYGCRDVGGEIIVTDQLNKSGYDFLIVRADQSSNAVQVSEEIKKLGVGATDAQSFIDQQLGIFNILGLILGGIGGIALFVAAVGVVNTMVMAILERTREIGVMRAVGARRSVVSRLFTLEASLLGFFGGLVGLGIGYGLTYIVNPLINKQLAESGLTAKNIISLPPWLIIGVIIITTFIGMLAGLYPARRAARLDPVEALHYE